MPESISIDAFAAMTSRVIERDGFDGYLPTVIYPRRRTIAVLEGAPGNETTESVALRWALASAHEKEEFLLAFKADESHFKVLHWTPCGIEARVFVVPTSS